MQTSFVEYFTLAQNSALKERESQIVDMRYGFVEGKAQTLEQVGIQIGVSRERIRQLLAKAHRKILSKGNRSIKKGDFSEPCAALIQYVQDRVRPDEIGTIERFSDLIETELSFLPLRTHALPLIGYFFLL